MSDCPRITTSATIFLSYQDVCDRVVGMYVRFKISQPSAKGLLLFLIIIHCTGKTTET